MYDLIAVSSRSKVLTSLYIPSQEKKRNQVQSAFFRTAYFAIVPRSSNFSAYFVCTRLVKLAVHFIYLGVRQSIQLMSYYPHISF